MYLSISGTRFPKYCLLPRRSEMEGVLPPSLPVVFWDT
ncbi:unnamed protein product [Staurois parvus]|uniref:Uncharacterized protein n=1 Tax=Staurois parvus TaxID=386267 RepID=A0ABN9DJN6_9NEOB|nr:unnamed protein product [Staurois parvus]